MKSVSMWCSLLELWRGSAELSLWTPHRPSTHRHNHHHPVAQHPTGALPHGGARCYAWCALPEMCRSVWCTFTASPFWPSEHIVSIIHWDILNMYVCVLSAHTYSILFYLIYQSCIPLFSFLVSSCQSVIPYLSVYLHPVSLFLCLCQCICRSLLLLLPLISLSQASPCVFCDTAAGRAESVIGTH